MIQIDPQATGWEDDRSESGRTRIKPVRGKVVLQPFRESQYATQIVGTAGVTPFDAFSTTTEGNSGNQHVLNVSVPSGITSGAQIWQPFYGSVFGISFKLINTNIGNISVGIDGEYFPVPHLYPPIFASRSFNVVDGNAFMLIADDLNDGPHMADICVTPDAATTAAIRLYGYLVDANAGYREFGSHAFPSVGLITNVAVAVSLGSAPYLGRVIRKIIYHNTDASTRTVTIQFAGSTIWRKQIAAGDTAEFDPGATTSFYPNVASGIAHLADVTNVVRATVITGI